MNALYAAMDALLPCEWLHYTFMKNALLAMLLITPLASPRASITTFKKISNKHTSCSILRSFNAFIRYRVFSRR